MRAVYSLDQKARIQDLRDNHLITLLTDTTSAISAIMGSLNNTSGKSIVGSGISFLLYFYFILKFFELGSICCKGGLMRFRVDANFLSWGAHNCDSPKYRNE